jgi:hypothetical protein
MNENVTNEILYCFFFIIEPGRHGYPGSKGQRGEHGIPGPNVSNINRIF